MQLVEIRDLDGPNILLLEPAIKLELALGGGAELETLIGRLRTYVADGGPLPDGATAALTALVHRWLVQIGQPVHVAAKWLETPGHLAIGFGWTHRRAAVAIGELLVKLLAGEHVAVDAALTEIGRLERNVEDDDRPLMVRDIDRRIPVVGITATNGKTTTTRLLAHMLMRTGRRVGWSSSSGVYIDGREVLTGDYSGPSGALRVLHEGGLDVAVLETARGGILLRGIAYEHNDVSVFINVSADHLDLQGVRTVRGLAEVKSVVVKVTRPGGTAVLNADDELVMAATEQIAASKLLFSRNPDSPAITKHLAGAGRVVLLDGTTIVYDDGRNRHDLGELAEIPMTFGGRAGHMVENAMAASGAALALGLAPAQVADGLKSFRNAPDQNLGRLNVYDLGGVTVILDYAHNEAGLEQLLGFARSYRGPAGKLAIVIGTAGDRTNESLRGIGRIAGNGADKVVVKLTRHYLRGRDEHDLVEQYQLGLRAAGREDAPVAETELEGLQLGMSGTNAGDVVAIMCQEQMAEITSWLRGQGAVER
jgi:cyanophycin synthetase